MPALRTASGAADTLPPVLENELAARRGGRRRAPRGGGGDEGEEARADAPREGQRHHVAATQARARGRDERETRRAARQYKSSSLEGESSRTTSENLTRKVQLLEEELDVAEKNVKETVEKCVPFAMWRPCPVARRDVRSLTCAPRVCVCLFTPG